MKGRVAVVTGAGQGLGRAFARAFAAQGAIPVIAEINEEKARAVAGETGGLCVPTDVSDSASVEAMARAALEAFGRIDVLVNNAAIFSTLEMRPFDEIPLEEWERVLRVNVTGAFLCARAVAPAMRKAGWGRIVNVASGAVSLGRPNYLHYVASKAALVGMSNSLARELGAHGITVNAICPGFIATEMSQGSATSLDTAAKKAMLGRVGQPNDIALPALFLASDDAAFVTAQVLSVDGGRMDFLSHSA